MPTKQINIVFNTVGKISEVNTRRETLTVWNWNPTLVILTDDDAPFVDIARIKGIPISPYTRVTLERKDGDQPDRAWYVFSRNDVILVVHEGMTPASIKRWY